MPKNRKFFPHGCTLLITSRTEEGLPMPANHVMNHIIWGVLAEARSKYDVKICHFIFMANHLHMLLVISNPAHVSDFMKYVKAEIAHAVNRLLARPKKTIWAEGYDSPVLLTANRVVHYIVYIYLNPVRANLVESIDDYPGVSSWKMFRDGCNITPHSRIPRSRILPLHSPALTVAEQKEIVDSWKSQRLPEKQFVLEPWAWLKAFPKMSRERVEREIFSKIKLGEKHLKELRRRNGKSVTGITMLRRQSMAKEHYPETHSRRMIVICEDKTLRAQFIEHYKRLASIARKTYDLWKRGNLTAKIPPWTFCTTSPSPCLRSCTLAD